MAELDLCKLARMLGRVKLQTSLPRRQGKAEGKASAHLHTATLKLVPVSEWAQCTAYADRNVNMSFTVNNQSSLKGAGTLLHISMEKS